MRLRYLALAAVLLTSFNAIVPPRLSAAPETAVLRYLSPVDGSEYHPRRATIALRLNGPLAPASVSPSLFAVVGESSGAHSGTARLSDDGATVIFKPSAMFDYDEMVTVTVGSGLALQSGAVFAGFTSHFKITDGLADIALAREVSLEEASGVELADPVSAPSSQAAVAGYPQDYITFPDEFPPYTITVPATGTAPGLLFMAPFGTMPNASGPYLYIADDRGEPVFWKALGVKNAFDFKPLWNGQLSYFYTADSGYHILDNSYTEVEVVRAGNGYIADQHEFQLLPDAHALLMAYDPQLVDMSVITTGGQVTATVIGLVVQELDLARDVVFQWRSWDHYLITDTTASLTTASVDYVHGNAIEPDHDGNLLVSARHLDEITKIDRETGAVIWRLGGKNNQFTIDDPDGPFAHQHDIRRLPNGDLTFFDNHNNGPFSRAVEYHLNEFTKTADNVWQYRNNPDVYASATGNAQRLPDGHTLIGWGFGTPNITEVLTDGTKVFEWSFAVPFHSYRVFRFPWSAVPAWPPELVVITDTVTPTLHYSWNGATDVAYYQIFAGRGPGHLQMVASQPRTHFEDQTEVSGALAPFCAFQVRPVDAAGQPMTISNMVLTRPDCVGGDWFFPMIFGP